MDGHTRQADEFVDRLVELNRAKGRVSAEDILRALVDQLEGLADASRDRLKFYLERLHTTSREKARERAGLTKSSGRVKLAQTAEERNAELLRSLDLAFRSVSSLPANVVDRLRERLRQGVVSGISTEQVLRDMLQDELSGLDLEDEQDLREAIRRVWDRSRSDLLRVIRTETVNAYSRVQLQEWADAGIQRVTRHSIDDDVTCGVCRTLSRPPDNVYDIASLLVLDYPVTQDPAGGGWLTHPNCRCLNFYAKVYTIDGWRMIGKINVGDLVLTHEGKFKKVIALRNQTSWPRGGGFVRLTFQRFWRSGRYGVRKWVIESTPDHPFLTDKGWRLAKDITTEDRIKTLARRCEHCGALYPWNHQTEEGARFCSADCAVRSDWERPERHDVQRVRTKQQVGRENRGANWSLEKKSSATAAGRKVLGKRIAEGTFHLQRENRTFVPWMYKAGPERDVVCARISRTKIETGQNARACAAAQGTLSKGQRELYERIRQLNPGAILNYPIQPERGKRSYVLDVAIPEHKICIEYDGSYWHSTERAKEKDRYRDEVLAHHGWATLRVAEGESFEPIIARVRRLLHNHEGRYEFMWLNPIEVELYSLKRSKRLYNLEVEGDHSYIVAGIVSHNCWFEPIVEDVWQELEGLERELFTDLENRDVKALSVPIDSQEHVQRMLKELSTPLTMQFVRRIEETPEWQTWRLQNLLDLGISPDRAQVMMSDESFSGTLTEWTSPTGVHYIADTARSIDHVTLPMARAEAEQWWETLDHDWIQQRFYRKKKELGSTLESEGVQIFGGQPFINLLASGSARDYFIESYASYMVNPAVLRILDAPIYDWLNDQVFHGREFLERGGVK